MQTYPLILAAGGAANTIQLQADLFVYESGTATPASGDTRIAVKSDNGAEIVLRPGQRFRTPEVATRWTVSAYDKASAIGGFIIIGSGEFDDANTKNVFTLDATFANTVKVTNTGAEAVPVALQAGASVGINNTVANRIPVSLDAAQTLNIAGSTVNYTHTYKGTASSTTNAPIQLLAAAANVNGAVLEKFDLVSAGSSISYYVVAKATAPANVNEGDLLHVGMTVSGGVASMDVSKNGRVRAPAGMGIWYITGNPDSATLRSALMTVL